uniref:Tripartite motif containing 69 n=1 Tax=Paramormyrops kingsleyae TaxID=1676925 RepID=A0A3B3QD20_9TELE
MAARSAKGRAQRLSKDLTCSICLDLFKKPVSLPCDHTFCRACIAGFWSRPPRLGQDQVFPSQSCRPNRIVASIVESYCQGLEEGESLGTGRAAAEAMPQCARHQEDLKLFCEDDQELVCLVCGVSQEHKSHTLVCIQEAQQRYLKQRIEAQFSDLHQFLYQEEKMLQVKLKTEERRELIRLDEHRAVLNVEISQLRRSLAEIEDRLKERDPYQLLKVRDFQISKEGETKALSWKGEALYIHKNKAMASWMVNAFHQ